MVAGKWVAGLAFAHQGAGDSHGLFQPVRLIEAAFGSLTDDVVAVRVQVSLLT
jgi:hypothetical protein